MTHYERRRGQIEAFQTADPTTTVWPGLFRFESQPALRRAFVSEVHRCNARYGR